MSKPKLATIWLDGCSGCHMSFLDIDDRIIELAGRVDIVYSPIVDTKEFPEDVDITLVEGSVSNEEDLHKIKMVRSRTNILIALGDCAVTDNIPSMRNPYGPEATLRRAYIENTAKKPKIPNEVIPKLLDIVRPVNKVVKVDYHIPGCPPPANAIYDVITELLDNKIPEPIKMTRFGK